MARKPKTTLEYITFDCVDKTTLKRLHRKFGNEGRLFWYELLRLLGRTENYVLNLSNQLDLEDILEGELFVSKDLGVEILNTLSDWGNIDLETWTIHKNVWCQSLIDRHEDVFKKRNNFPVNPYTTVIIESETIINGAETIVSDTEIPQSKVKEIKGKKTKEERKEEKTKIAFEKCAPQNSDLEDFNDFLSYWFESGDNDRKMRFEKQSSFDWKRRWGNWLRNKHKWQKEKKVTQKKEKRNAGQILKEKYGRDSGTR